MVQNSMLAAVAQTLEREFFAKEDERLLEKLRKKDKREALRELVQVEDDAFLERLIELGISPETVLALMLVPLTAVVWADGKLEDREREAIIKAAEENGISQGTAEYQLLRSEPPNTSCWKRGSLTGLAKRCSRAGRGTSKVSGKPSTTRRAARCVRRRLIGLWPWPSRPVDFSG